MKDPDTGLTLDDFLDRIYFMQPTCFAKYVDYSVLRVSAGTYHVRYKNKLICICEDSVSVENIINVIQKVKLIDKETEDK